MWYLVIFIGYFSGDAPNINIITNQKFKSLEECVTHEINIQNNHMTYDELCIFDEDLENIPFDRLIDGMEPNQEIIFKIPNF